MSDEQENSYETIMTVGKAAYIRPSDEPDLPTLTSSLPVPEGKGWKLEHIIPVHNNPKYLQYFWQRKHAQSNDQMTNEQGINFRSGSIKLG